MPDEPTRDDDPKGAPPAEEPPHVEPEGGSHEEGEDEADEAPEDLASPEAIARRVAVFGDEDEADVIARREEEKLAERRKREKKKKKGGLEAAASKRLAKIGTRAPVKSSIPTAAEAAPIVERAIKWNEWAKKNQSTVAIVVGGAFAVLAGVFGYAYYEKQRDSSASTELGKAIGDEKGRVGDPDKEDEEGHPHDPRPIFKTAEERRESALKKFRMVSTKFKGTGAAILARLEEGSLLLDKSDVPGATSAFNEVKDSPLAKADAEVHGRALEGLGFADELKAEGEQGDPRHATLEDAGKVYRELENTEVAGFKEIAMYHQARILQKLGDTAKAIEILKKLMERLSKPEDSQPFVYLEHVAEDRLRDLDPLSAPPKAPPGMGGPGGKGSQFSTEQIKRMMEQAQKRQQQGKPPGPPGAPPPPPAPGTPSP